MNYLLPLHKEGPQCYGHCKYHLHKPNQERHNI